MKVRIKLALLLAVVVLTFLGGVVAVRIFERKRFCRFHVARTEERSRSFGDFLQQWGEPLETFVRDVSAWNSLVAGLGGDTGAWAESNLTEPGMTLYHAHAVWLYRPSGDLAATRNLLYTSKLEPPLPPEPLAGVLARSTPCHFFSWTSQGLMELRGAPAQASQGSASQGYLFAGRLWSNADLREMSLLTGNEVLLKSPGQGPAKPSEVDFSVVEFARDLPGLDGQPVALLVGRNASPVVGLLQRSSTRLFVGTIGFAVLLSLLLLVSFRRWLHNPLKTLSVALREQDLGHLRRLQAKGDEFGELARLMKDFFEQRQNLLREVAERRLAEEALHESEERLRHSQKMEAVGRLAGGVAHDFNNLLTAIIGYAELIAQRSQEALTREEASLIGKAGEQAADLTRQLLAFSRKQILQPRVLDLTVLVGELQKLLGRVIGEKITLKFETVAESTRVCADPTQLEQVVLNLGVNARDAMPRGGVLTTSVARRQIGEPLEHTTGTLPPGDYVTLTIEDTGCGMDAETQARIFEPFFTTKAAGKGTGLGLATVYGVVHQSGGAICVDSEPGRGTSFTVYLPRVEAPVEKVNALTVVPTTFAGATVLVVEDEDFVNELVCTVLRAEGCHVLCAVDGRDGLEVARAYEGHIDLLLSDVVMPHTTGPELARELHVTRPEMKVLFVSGYSEADISEDGVLAAGVNLLPKPFTPETLTRRVRKVLECAEVPA